MDSKDRLGRLSDVVFIATCVLVAGLALYRFIPNETSVVMSAADLPAFVGSTVELRDVDFSGAPRTALVVVSSTCRFCTESMPFYRRLVERQRTEPWQVVFVGMQDAAIVTEYLGSHGVKPAMLVPISASLRVRSTPTLMIVDAGGRVTHAVAGRLSPKQEEEALRALGQ